MLPPLTLLPRVRLQVGALLVGFGAVALLFLYTFLRGVWLVYYMLRLSNGRLNSALVSAMWICLATLSECSRHVVYISRNIPTSTGLTVAQHEFDLYINASLGVTIVSLAEGLMSLGLAWISVAEKCVRSQF